MHIPHDFYGCDEGYLEATYPLELHSPTRSGPVLRGTTPIGEDLAGGRTDLDASVRIRLEEGGGLERGAPSQPGFHVKLTVEAEGSIGADTKHKVFWVKARHLWGTTVTPSPTTVPSPSAVPVPTVAPSVLQSTIGPTGGLTFTGGDRERLGALAFALLLLGTAALRASQRRERRHYNRG